MTLPTSLTRGVALVETGSAFSVLTRFGHDLVAGLKAEGVHAEFIAGDGSLTVDQVAQRLLAREWDAVVAFNGGALPTSGYRDRPILDQVAAPFWSLMLDPCWHHTERFATAVPSRRWTWVDPTHAAQAAERFPGSGAHHVLSHAGYSEMQPATTRDIPVLMLGSWSEPREVLATIGRLGASHESLARACLARWQREGGDPYPLILDEHAVQRSNVPILEALFACESLLRAWVRIAVAEGLAARRIKALIVGRGAMSCPSLAAHDRRESVEFGEALHLMSRAQVLVEAGPLFPNGSHERVLSAFANGAAVVLARTAFWTTQFTENEAFLGFDPRRPDQAAGQVLGLLRDRKRRERIAEAAKAAVIASWTPQHQARRLLELIKAG